MKQPVYWKVRVFFLTWLKSLTLTCFSRQDVKDTVPLALRLILLPEGEPPNKPDGSPGLRDVKR